MSYFFSHGQPGEFQYFSFPHFVPLFLMVLIIYLIYRFRDKIKEFKHEDNIRLVLAFIMIIADMSYFWHKMYIGAEIKNHLPITVCGWSAILGGFMLLSKKQSLFDIVYFWVLAGSINALITPAVITDNGPTHFRYYQFWIEHTSIFIAVFYMIFVHKYKVNFKSLIKAFVAIVFLTLIAIYVNSNITGANYLFLSTTEAGDSILNFLPNNLGLRLLVMGGVILFLFFLSYLPWLIIKKSKRID
ncbi:TIGR02206 family membrane protein [Mycoplasmatota bacterium]|nr:TIGR02206 family membrane protein [Mycoplasmatota bacterium]